MPFFFGADMISSEHIDNKNEDVLILGEGPIQELDYTTLTAEAKYPINFTEPRKRFVLCLNYNGTNRFFFVNATKIYQLKAKDFEIKDYTLFLGNILKDFTIDNVKKARLKESVNFFSVDFNPIDTNDFLDIHKHSIYILINTVKNYTTINLRLN